MMQIPIYRSLELDTACEIVGFYVKENGFYRVNGEDDVERPVVRHYILGEYGERYEIAPEFLAINFPNMIDKNGKKTWLSLDKIYDYFESKTCENCDNNILDTVHDNIYGWCNEIC